MKFYYSLTVLVQLLLALLSGNKNKISYLFYLWREGWGSEVEREDINKNPKTFAEKSEIDTKENKYSFLLER